ncbi:MAG: Lcl C-terminal domain-containing protein, partial [Candidatus Heimdallarchaeaceae archaeon]
GDATVFGVNFADGRIKGYPRDMVPSGLLMQMFTLYVRGNENYCLNDFVDNNNSTITDRATGLMWSKTDSGEGMNWANALSWVQQKNSENYLGYNDWRLPHAKEMQSIVDYSRAPSITNSAAIDPIFNVSPITDEGGSLNYPFYFGEALGWMQNPITEEYVLLDVHGAGSQRSDPKTGEASDYPCGHGPQGDVIRINNYVRCVRGGVADIAESEDAYSQYFAPTNTNSPSFLIGISSIIIVISLARCNKIKKENKGIKASSFF